jgi:hypothetical protein
MKYEAYRGCYHAKQDKDIVPLVAEGKHRTSGYWVHLESNVFSGADTASRGR